MSLTAFQRYRRLKQVEEMKPENLAKKEEAPLENFTSETLVPDELPNEEPEEIVETKTSNRRKNK